MFCVKVKQSSKKCIRVSCTSVFVSVELGKSLIVGALSVEWIQNHFEFADNSLEHIPNGNEFTRNEHLSVSCPVEHSNWWHSINLSIVIGAHQIRRRWKICERWCSRTCQVARHWKWCRASNGPVRPDILWRLFRTDFHFLFFMLELMTEVGNGTDEISLLFKCTGYERQKVKVIIYQRGVELRSQRIRCCDVEHIYFFRFRWTA